jgi:pilus assembly protein CpaB
MKQQRTLIVLAVAVIAAGVAAYGVYSAVQNMPVREVEVASIPVVVASEPIPIGTRLTADQVRVAQWPARNPVPGAFSDPKQIIDRGVIATMAENEPVTAFKVAGPESGSGLPPVIPEGMRALSIRVNDIVGVAGFVMPGTHVDVLLAVDVQWAERLLRDTARVAPYDAVRAVRSYGTAPWGQRFFAEVVLR